MLDTDVRVMKVAVVNGPFDARVSSTSTSLHDPQNFGWQLNDLATG